MSFQAYLDNIEEKTGKAPKQFIAEAKKKKLTESRDIIAWLKQDYGLGLGHARALDYVIRHGPEFEVRQTTGPHRDASGTLQLEGKSKRSKEGTDHTGNLVTKKGDSRKQAGDFPKLAAPAQRALDAAGIKNLKQLSKHAEAEIKGLHGMGPNALGKLRQALAEQGLSFKAKA